MIATARRGSALWFPGAMIRCPRPCSGRTRLAASRCLRAARTVVLLTPSRSARSRSAGRKPVAECRPDAISPARDSATDRYRSMRDPGMVHYVRFWRCSARGVKEVCMVWRRRVLHKPGLHVLDGPTESCSIHSSMTSSGLRLSALCSRHGAEMPSATLGPSWTCRIRSSAGNTASLLSGHRRGSPPPRSEATRFTCELRKLG